MSAEMSDLASTLFGLAEKENVIDNEEEAVQEEGEEAQEEEYVEEEVEGEVEESESADEEPSPEDAEATTSDESEAYYPETLDDLVEAYEGDADKLKSITVASKKNGEKVSLGQVLANWEIGEAATRKSQEASELKKHLEQERQQFHSTLADKIEEQGAVLEALENLYKTAGSAELDELRTTNPAEYAARKAELMERDKVLDQVKQEIAGKKQKAQEEAQKTHQEKYGHYVQDQAERMLEMIPEWQDVGKFNEEFGEINAYMGKVGFSEKEVAGIIDARVRKLVRDAMLYNRVAKTADPKKKRIVKKPKKVVRAGGTNKGNVKSDAFKRRVANAKKTKNARAKSSVIAELIMNS